MKSIAKTIMRFEHTSEDWSGLNAAVRWLNDNGYSVGTLQRDAPIGILKGDALISKWRNMSPAEKASLDGCITPDGGLFRNSAAIVQLYGETA